MTEFMSMLHAEDEYTRLSMQNKGSSFCVIIYLYAIGLDLGSVPWFSSLQRTPQYRDNSVDLAPIQSKLSVRDGPTHSALCIFSSFPLRWSARRIDQLLKFIHGWSELRYVGVGM